MTFINDFTQCFEVYFMKQKRKVLDKFKQFEAIMINASGCKIAKT